MFQLLGTRGAGALSVQVGGAAAAFALNLSLARTLGVAEYGLFSFAFTSVGLLVMFCKLGSDRLLMREMSRMQDGSATTARQEFISTIMTVSVVTVGAVGFALLVFSSRSLTGKSEVLLYSLALAWPMALVYATQGALRGLGRIVTAMLPRFVVFPVCLVVVLLALNQLGFDLRAAPVLLMASVCMTAALLLSLYWVGNDLGGLRPNRWPRAGVLRGVLHKTAPFLLITVAGAAISSIDIIVVGALSSASAVGLYAAGVKCVNLLAMMLAAGNLMIGPYVAKLYYGGEHHRLQELISGTVLLVTTAVTGGLFLYIIGGRFVLQWFGTAFEEGYTVLILLAIGQLVSAMCGPTALVCGMVGLEWYATRVLVLTVLGMLLGLLWIVPLYGAVGAAVINILANVAWNVSMVIRLQSQRQLKLSVFHGIGLLWSRVRSDRWK